MNWNYYRSLNRTWFLKYWSTESQIIDLKDSRLKRSFLNSTINYHLYPELNMNSCTIFHHLEVNFPATATMIGIERKCVVRGGQEEEEAEEGSRRRSSRKDYWKSFQLNSIISLNLWYNYNFLFSFSLYHFSGFNFSTFQMQLINFDYYFFVVISVYFIWIYFGSLLHFNRKFTINLNGNCIHCRWILMATYFYSNI